MGVDSGIVSILYEWGAVRFVCTFSTCLIFFFFVGLTNIKRYHNVVLKMKYFLFSYSFVVLLIASSLTVFLYLLYLL